STTTKSFIQNLIMGIIGSYFMRTLPPCCGDIKRNERQWHPRRLRVRRNSVSGGGISQQLSRPDHAHAGRTIPVPDDPLDPSGRCRQSRTEGSPLCFGFALRKLPVSVVCVSASMRSSASGATLVVSVECGRYIMCSTARLWQLQKHIALRQAHSAAY